MKSWIYLKKENRGFDDIRAAALASVLRKSGETHNVVHTNVISIYLNRLENINIGYPNESEGDKIITLELPDYAPFQLLCKMISKRLDIPDVEVYEPYLGFVRKENEIDKQLSKSDNIVLYCYYMNDRDALLIPQLEKTIEILDINGYSSVCCGSRKESLLKGSYDYRELIQIDEIIKNRKRIKAIVTSLSLVKEIGCLLNIPVVYLYTYAFIVYYRGSILVKSTLANCSQKLVNVLEEISNGTLSNEENPSNNFVKNKFEIPYSFDEDILPYFNKYSSYINFLFLPPYADDAINTRTSQQSKVKGHSYMPSTRDEYEYHIRLIKENKLNFVILWQDRYAIIPNKMLDYYSKLGARGFIIANDKNAQIIKEYNPNLLVISSIVQRLCKGITKKDFRYYDYIVLFYPFNRSLSVIKQLSKIKEKLIIMPNSFCHTDCQGIQHWFVKDVKSFKHDKSCPAFLDNNKSTFIRPDHLFLFDDYVGGYKLQGREWSTDYVVTICEAYFNREMPKYLILSEKLNDELQIMMSRMSLDDYYNLKTPEIETIV